MWVAFGCGLVIGTAIGVFVMGLLAGPRMAELESTVQGLREVINNLEVGDA